jgi:DNA-binding transcriptional LysR family regulator
VTHAAVSQSHAGRLENRRSASRCCGRTTRSVSLTEAGERLHAAMAPAMAGHQPGGRGRTTRRPRRRRWGCCGIAASSIAERLHLRTAARHLCATRYPDVRLDVDDDRRGVRHRARGYDAGVRLGEVIEQDMIARCPCRASSGNSSWRRPPTSRSFGTPAHPRDLTGASLHRLAARA